MNNLKRDELVEVHIDARHKVKACIPAGTVPLSVHTQLSARAVAAGSGPWAAAASRRGRPASHASRAPLVYQLHPLPLQYIAHRCSPAENQVVHLAQHSCLRLRRERLIPTKRHVRTADQTSRPTLLHKRHAPAQPAPLAATAPHASLPGARGWLASRCRAMCPLAHHFASLVFPCRLKSVMKWIDPFFSSASSPMLARPPQRLRRSCGGPRRGSHTSAPTQSLSRRRRRVLVAAVHQHAVDLCGSAGVYLLIRATPEL